VQRVRRERGEATVEWEERGNQEVWLQSHHEGGQWETTRWLKAARTDLAFSQLHLYWVQGEVTYKAIVQSRCLHCWALTLSYLV
jgi:hypothetical protein